MVCQLRNDSTKKDLQTSDSKSATPGRYRKWRTFLRDVVVAILASQTTRMKLWELRRLQRYVLWLLFQLEKEQTVVASAGPTGYRFRMHLDWQNGTSNVLGTYEPEMIRALQQNIKPGDTCIDVGGNIGYVTLLMARLVGPSGHIVSFEPVPEIFQILEENVRLNCFKNTILERSAVGKGETAISLILPICESFTKTASVLGYAVSGESRSIAVPSTSLDDYVSRTGLRPGLVKIDVEGAELSVLRGARETLQQIRPVLLVEIHDLGKEHKEKVLGLLAECGYAVSGLGTMGRQEMCLALPVGVHQER
jgi:FkbM family methyltransferase